MFWITDNLIRMKNASILGKEKVNVRGTKFFLEILKKIQEEGFIKNFSVLNDLKQTCEVELKYFQDQSLLKNVKFFSTPKNRRYISSDAIKKYMKNFQCVFLSTNLGVLSGKEAIEKNVGGEILFWIGSY